MTAATLALGIVTVVVLGTILFALISVRRLPADPAQLVVGNRSIGTVFLWFLLAGEVYTSFTFLGTAGWAYGFGAPAFYIVGYGAAGYAIAYLLLPMIWRAAKVGNYLTASDFFVDRFGSRTLGIIVAIVQVGLMIPYVTLQLSGLEILLSIAGFGTINATLAASIGFGIITIFVFTAGLRGTAWASVVKDILVIGGVLFAGIAIPVHFFGSPAAMFDQLLKAHPQMLTLGSATAIHGGIWYATTMLLTSLGFFMSPHSIAAVYSANSENALRRNAIVLPLYQLVLLLMLFAGFSALLIVPGMHGAAVDQSFLIVTARYYPAWIVGFIAAAGSLAALVPASAILLAAGSVFSRNLIGALGWMPQRAAHQTLMIRLGILIVAALALVLWLTSSQTLGALLLLVYNGISQILPGFVCGLMIRQVRAAAVIGGILVGAGFAFYATLTSLPLAGANPGFVGLLLNVVTIVVMTIASHIIYKGHLEK